MKNKWLLILTLLVIILAFACRSTDCGCPMH